MRRDGAATTVASCKTAPVAKPPPVRSHIVELLPVDPAVTQRHLEGLGVSALLDAGVELASFGVEGQTDFFATDLGRAMLQVESADELASMIGSAMLGINTPSAGLWTTFVSAAHADQELSRYHARMLSLIRAQVEHVLRYIDARGWLRRDVPLDDLVEAFCIITCLETYVRFVEHDGIPPARYEEFVARTVRETTLAR